MTTVTEERVEAGARAAYAWTYGEDVAKHRWPHSVFAKGYRDQARAVLTAALAAKPEVFLDRETEDALRSTHGASAKVIGPGRIPAADLPMPPYYFQAEDNSGGSVVVSAKPEPAVDSAAFPELAANPEGWRPIIECPTDGVERKLLLPDGSEVFGCFIHPPGRWRAWTGIEIDFPAQKLDPVGGVERWSAPYKTRVYGNLPDGVYPTHFLTAAPTASGEGG